MVCALPRLSLDGCPWGNRMAVAQPQIDTVNALQPVADFGPPAAILHAQAQRRTAAAA